MAISLSQNSAEGARPEAPATLGLLYRAPLLGGEAGTAQTIKLMRQLVDQAVSDPQFVRFVVDLVRHVPAYYELGELSAFYQWVQSNIRYTKDPVTKEKLYPPMELLKIRAGDCDDISMLLGAMAITLGYPARLVTISANPQDPQEFSHVYIEAEVPAGSNQWVPMDAARPSAEFGLEPPYYFRKRAWSLTDDSFQDLKGATKLSGLGGYAGLADGFDWSGLSTQIVQEIPAIISTASGGGATVQNRAGTVATSGPYGSFATPYTPGYGIPPAGYGAVQVQTSGWFTQNWPLVALGLFAFMALGKRT